MSYKRVIHLSDLHLTASGHDEDGVDAVRSLQLVLDALQHVENITAVIVSGDIADDGSVAGCEAALHIVGEWAAARGAACVFSTGNHDSRHAFESVLGSGHRVAQGGDVGDRGPDGTCAATSEVSGLRLVTLDSLVPGRTHGVLGGDQLDWLRDLLTRPAPAGTVLAFHHPPISVPKHPTRAILLDDPAGLADVIAGTDVRAVLTGHLHQQLSGTLGGVPVWVTPGVLTRLDASAPTALGRVVLGGSGTVVDLPDGEGPIFRLVHARDPRAGELVHLFDIATGALVTDERPVA